jgi:hypothetical protein
MDELNVFELYQFMQNQHVMLSFKGDVSQDVLISVGDLLKEKLSNEDAKQRVAKKVFFIFIELAQNIYRYSAEHSVIDNKQIGTGVLIIRECDTHFTILAGNMVAPTAATNIATHCAAINQLEQADLKRLYKQRLKQPRKPGQLGGGVGLISVVRKAANPLKVHTTVIDDNRTFLVLSIQVNKE